MTDAVETTLKKIVQRKGRWEGPGWIVGVAGILLFIVGLVLTLPIVAELGLGMVGMGIILVVIGKVIRTDLFKK